MHEDHLAEDRHVEDTFRTPQIRNVKDRAWAPPPTIGRPDRKQPWDIPDPVLAEPPERIDETHEPQAPADEHYDTEPHTEPLSTPIDVADSVNVPEAEDPLPESLKTDPPSMETGTTHERDGVELPTAENTESDRSPTSEEYRFPTAPLPDEVQAAIDQITQTKAAEIATSPSRDTGLDLEPSFRPAEVSAVTSKHGLAEDLSEAVDSERTETTRIDQPEARVPESARSNDRHDNLTKDDIDLMKPLEAEATGDVETWQASEKDDPDYDEFEGVPEHLRQPSDAERLRKRLDKYPENRGDKKQAFKLNLNRASHRHGVVAVAILGVILIVSIFGLASRIQRERADRQATVERQVATMKISEGNVPSEQRIQHSDGQRIVNASVPLFGDSQIDQLTQAWAKDRIDEFEVQTSVLSASMPDKRPILALSHRSYLVEGELASIQLVAETYKNVKDLENGTLQKIETEDILYDISYRTFLSPTDIFLENAPSTLASLGTRKIQSGEYRVIETLAAPAFERQIEADRAQEEAADAAQGENEGGTPAPQDDVSEPQDENENGTPAPQGESNAPQAFFGVKTLRAEEETPTDEAEDGVVDDPATEDGVADGETPEDSPTEIVVTSETSSEIPRETETTQAEEETAPDTTYAAVVLPETTILYKYLRFQPDGLELELDPSLLSDNSQTVAIHYTYEEILDVVRILRRADGGIQLNLRIDPLGDTQRQYASRLLEALYGTGLEEQAIPAPTESSDTAATESSSEPTITESVAADAQPIESDAVDGVESTPADTPENGEQANTGNHHAVLFGAKVLNAEDASPMQGEENNNQADAGTVETTTLETSAANASTRPALEPTISRNLNQAGSFPQGGLTLADHFVNAKARYNQEIKYVGLTFNNAPNSETSQALLDLLKSYRGHGTFFVRGTSAAEESAGPLMQSIVEQGSELGNNAYNFYSFTVLTDAQIQSEINETASLIEEKAGVRPIFTRPPYGDYDERILQAGGVPMVNWSFTSGDDWGATADVIYETMLEYIEPGSIILSLDGNQDTIQAMQRVLPELYGRGYRFTTLSELFDIYTEEGPQDGVLYSSVWNW